MRKAVDHSNKLTKTVNQCWTAHRTAQFYLQTLALKRIWWTSFEKLLPCQFLTNFYVSLWHECFAYAITFTFHLRGLQRQLFRSMEWKKCTILSKNLSDSTARTSSVYKKYKSNFLFHNKLSLQRKNWGIAFKHAEKTKPNVADYLKSNVELSAHGIVSLSSIWYSCAAKHRIIPSPTLPPRLFFFLSFEEQFTLCATAWSWDPAVHRSN